MHLDRDEKSAEFWLRPVALAESLGFAAPELRKIARLVVEHEDLCVEAWNEHFGS